MIENNKKNKRLLLSQFSDTDVITQMDNCVDKHNCYWPQIVDYKQIIEENPDAIQRLNEDKGFIKRLIRQLNLV